MTQKIKLVMSDIDGTILTSQHKIDDKLAVRLKQLKAKKIPFVLASARSPKGMHAIAKKLEVTEYPMACYNGALIVREVEDDPFQQIFSQELNVEETLQLIELLTKEFKNISISLYSGSDWYVESVDDWIEQEAAITKLEPIVANLNQLLLEQRLPVHKLLLIGSTPEVEQLKEVCESLNLETSSFYLSKENYLEVTHYQVSKEKALTTVADYYQIPLENTMAIGDNFNDLPMIKLSGMGVAMGNAPEEVIKEADIQTLTNDENGVSEALLNQILLKEI
ncbi:HAD family hydrolase [Candidatus Enterococcus courvalinii]|uniref:HAD family phosphatase n=1 Tax=Candidatus Enterococcus courvalinii TaxID=2815329 RepID=A0ABS3HWI7_9ENTE|nr:HAD family hydrolase [Enterococcus sp. MSG2901]MBO0480756.1 HAD family phosphatase [Enterococcus sp. MSG2901]